MKIGVPRELKDGEFRVALTPAGTSELVRGGHAVLVEENAGAGSAIPDEEYADAGATMLGSPDELWGDAELVLKVKEPVPAEYGRMRRGQVLFTFLHLAASRECTDAILSSGVTSVAYETVQLADSSLPLLAPMSEVAGRLAVQAGARCLERIHGGRGVLLGGVPGVSPAKVVVLGAGISGTNAALIAAGMQADVVLIDKSVAKLRVVDRLFGGGRIRTLASNAHEIESACLQADLVIGAALVAGARAPMLVPEELVRGMRPGSVLVDISIDQGGCIEGSRPTAHSQPTFCLHDSVFYCVSNMPGAVPFTSTYALTNVTIDYVSAIADLGLPAATDVEPALAHGVTSVDGVLTSAPVAAAHGLPWRPHGEFLVA